MTPELSSSGIPQDHVAVLAEMYRGAADRMRKIILTPPGKTASSQEWNQARASSQLAQVERLITELKQSAAAWIGDDRDGSMGPVTQAMADGITRANKQAEAAGVTVPGSPFAGSFHLIDRGSAEFFAREIFADLQKAANGMSETAKKILRTTAQLKLPEAAINRILAGGVIAGQPTETIRELREELRAVHGDEVILKTKTGGTMSLPVGYYASMVARTQTRMATVHARHGRLEQLGLDLIAVIGRISKNFCTAFLGQVFSLSGKSTKYPPYSQLPEGGPPFHPNCSKGTRPFIESLATPTQLEQAEGIEDAQKLLGQPAGAAQRKFSDLQIHQQVKESFGSKNIYGVPSTAAAKAPEKSPSSRSRSGSSEEPVSVGTMIGEGPGAKVIRK